MLSEQVLVPQRVEVYPNLILQNTHVPTIHCFHKQTLWFITKCNSAIYSEIKICFKTSFALLPYIFFKVIYRYETNEKLPGYSTQCSMLMYF